jgi:hypothetical protein
VSLIDRTDASARIPSPTNPPFVSDNRVHDTRARVAWTRRMTAPKPKPRGGQRRAVGRQYSAPKATSHKRFERQLRTYWGSSWLVALLAKLAAAAGANGLGPPPLERPQEPPARESSGGYDSDASLGSICDFIASDSESEGEGESAHRRGRVGECPNANRPYCTRIDKNKKRRFSPPCIKRKLRVLDLCSGSDWGSPSQTLSRMFLTRQKSG